MANNFKKTNLIISGEGGQGIQTLTKIFTNAVFKSGLEVTFIPSFGVEQRGTPSTSFISIDKSPLRYPKFQTAGIVVILQNRAIKAVEDFITPNTKVIFDSSTISASTLPKRAIHLFGIPATQIATDKGNPKSFNLIILGHLAKIFQLDKDRVFDEVLNTLGKKFKNKEAVNLNREAFITGFEYIAEKDDFSQAKYKPGTKAIYFKDHHKNGQILPERCKGCGICVVKCPVAALSFGEELGVIATPVPKVNLERCIACGNCRNYCPDGAISITKIK